MDYSKISNESKVFFERYKKGLIGDELHSVAKKYDPKKAVTFTNIIKHLYLRHSHKGSLPEWYKTQTAARREELDSYFESNINRKIMEADFPPGLDAFIEEKLIRHYLQRGSFYLKSALNEFPLYLRLKMYFILYQKETNPKYRSYLRHFIANVMVQLGEEEVAKKLTIYNWVLAKKVEESYFNSIPNLNQTLKSHATRRTPGTLSEQLLQFYKRLLLTEDNYNYEALTTLELVSISYSKLPELKQLVFSMQTFLRTRNKALFKSEVRRLQQAFLNDYGGEMTDAVNKMEMLKIYKGILQL